MEPNSRLFMKQAKRLTERRSNSGKSIRLTHICSHHKSTPHRFPIPAPAQISGSHGAMGPLEENQIPQSEIVTGEILLSWFSIFDVHHNCFWMPGSHCKPNPIKTSEDATQAGLTVNST